MILRHAVAALTLVCVLDGCASSGSRSGSGSSQSILTAAQLASANSDNLFDAIQKLRPEWLTTRGPSSVTGLAMSAVSVYMNGSMLGQAEALRDLRLLDVTEVRYWDAGQASARFGMGHPRGVIEVTRK
jgi:hypothetical protein